jgi:hypothetical protein
MMMDFILMRARIWDRQHGYTRNWNMTAKHTGTLKTVAEIYGFEQVILIGRKAGQADMVATHGDNQETAGRAQRLGEYLEHKLKQWKDCDMDTVLTPKALPPDGAAS